MAKGKGKVRAKGVHHPEHRREIEEKANTRAQAGRAAKPYGMPRKMGRKR